MMASSETKRWLKACSIPDVGDNEIVRVHVEGIGDLSIYRIADQFFASDDICTHGQASLSEDGFLEGFNVVCSWHNGAFDVRSGQPTKAPCTETLTTYPVMLQGNDVYVCLAASDVVETNGG